VRKLGAPLLLIQAHEETVSGIAFVKKGILTSCSFDESIKVWDTVGGECLAQKFPKAGQFHTISAFQDELGVVAAGD
jgi:WD40 repeat protein